MAGLRLVLDVEVAAGNEHASKHAAPALWALLDRIPRDCWPAFLRGDSGFGTEAVMREAEQRGLPYLFKLRLTANVKKLIKKNFSKEDWTNAGQGWQGREDTLRLEGWSRQRQVVIRPRAPNWWNLFVRLAEPDRHLEAITSRPLLLSAIAERSRHARQTTLRVASSHAKAGWAASVLSGIARFLRELVQSAEQLTAGQRWRRILAHAVRGFLNGRQLRLPARLMAPT